MEHSLEPEFSIIIPALNEQRVISRCLQALCAQTLSPAAFEVIVSDNGSSDGTRDAAASFRGSLNLSVTASPGVPVAAVRNAGAAIARGRFFAFLDADCIVREDWLERASILLRYQPDAIIGAYYSIPSDASWVERTWYGDQHALKTGRVSYLPGSNLIVSRQSFVSLGGFDESIETSEDCEFCERAQARGIDVLAFPSLAVVHLGGPRTLGHFFRKQLWQGAGVATVFGRNWRQSQHWKNMLFTLFCLAALAGSVAGIILAAVSGQWLFVLPAPVAFCLGCLAAAGQAAASRHRMRRILPLAVLYGAYGLARSLVLTGVHASRHSAREKTPGVKLSAVQH